MMFDRAWTAAHPCSALVGRGDPPGVIAEDRIIRGFCARIGRNACLARLVAGR